MGGDCIAQPGTVEKDDLLAVLSNSRRQATAADARLFVR